MNIAKAYAISDAKIQFVSLVDKAANKQRFLITKADESGTANFTTYGSIVKKDDSHYVTGIVYEPMTEDSQGNYMTEDEIIKAQRWYAKNGNQVDLQHSFESLDNASVIESWVTKADCEIGGKEIKKGTWLMTVEVTDDDVWNSIQKGEITGFSMGGVGKYSEIDDDINKSQDREHKGIFKKLAEFFGFEVIEKGEVTERFKQKQMRESFWNAWYSLQETLCRWNNYSDRNEFVTDENAVKNALEEFSNIVTQILTSETGLTTKLIAPADEISKAGKKISNSNREKLQTVYENLGTFLAETQEKSKEDNEKMTDETKKEIERAVATAIEPFKEALKIKGKTATDDDSKKPVTKGDVQEIVKNAISGNNLVTTDNIADVITKALEPILSAAGLPSNLNNEPGEVQKPEQHYMTGMF